MERTDIDRMFSERKLDAVVRYDRMAAEALADLPAAEEECRRLEEECDALARTLEETDSIIIGAYGPVREEDGTFRVRPEWKALRDRRKERLAKLDAASRRAEHLRAWFEEAMKAKENARMEWLQADAFERRMEEERIRRRAYVSRLMLEAEALDERRKDLGLLPRA